MDKDDEILRLLREIRDTQIKNREEWLEALQKNELRQKQSVENFAKAKRRLWIVLGVLIVALFCIYYIPILLTPRQILPDFPELSQYSNPVATPKFDGSYTVDSEKLQEYLHSHFVQHDSQQHDLDKQLLAAFEDRFYNFRINHGVITSGKVLIQEFRITSADMEDGKLRGRAIWHEDIHDPGDCTIINVQLSIEGDVLEFWFFPDGEEKGEPVILRRAQK
jgi:hypothetical protein